MLKTFITSESVTEGHPDKMCDQISDAILDSILNLDPFARVGCEAIVSTGMVLVMGEITTSCYVDYTKVARDTIKEIGYDNSDYGFGYDNCAILIAIKGQSVDLSQGIDVSLESRTYDLNTNYTLGAGDQGTVYGYACDETDEFMPLPIELAHKLAKRLTSVRKNLILPYLRPDGKTQITVEYNDGKPVRIDTVVVSAQHDDNIEYTKIYCDIKRHVIDYILPENLVDENTKYFINTTGRFVIGGPTADTGLTGRKQMVDTYGGVSKHGGGSFSGKDPSKMDRSAAYMARYIAKNLVAAGIATKCEIGISYAIGVANPISVTVDSFGTGKMSDERIVALVKELFDLRPDAIIEELQLRSPIYQQVSKYGHFGRSDLGVTWERLNMIDIIKYRASLM